MAIGEVLGEIVVDGMKYTFGDAVKVDGKFSYHGCLIPNNGNDVMCHKQFNEVSNKCFELGGKADNKNCQVVKIEAADAD